MKFNRNLQEIGEEFEYAIEAFFQERGFPVFDTPSTHDFGVDLILYFQGKCIAIQCKNHLSPVGIDAVQAIAAGITYYHADLGVVICSGRFTAAARKLAAANHVALIDGDSVRKILLEDDADASYFSQLIERSSAQKEEDKTSSCHGILKFFRLRKA